MFYRSLFTNAFTACALFSGEIALADSFNISKRVDKYTGRAKWRRR